MCTFALAFERKKASKKYAEIAQLVEHDLAKVGVASSSLVFRSRETPKLESMLWWWNGRHEGLKIPCPQGRVGSSPTRSTRENNAEIAQLVEHDLAKVGVASSSLVFRSKKKRTLKS